MSRAQFHEHVAAELAAIEHAGLRKAERPIATRQDTTVTAAGHSDVLNFCANNYLGLAGDGEVVAAARAAAERWGYGMASVRFICGTQDVHLELERKLSAFLGTQATILYSSCFDANGGLFECLFGADDAIISDQLNHASIIDGIRLCKAARFRYRNNDMADLERCLQEAQGARFRIIATDGVFSMDGIIADLAAICELADRYDALVMVDDSHATGFVGPGGRGTPAACGVADRVDFLTSTLGKALGGASGGFTSGPAAAIELLRQRSRPYLFSNSLCPIIAETTCHVLDHIAAADEQRERLQANTRRFREGMRARGFEVPAGEHPIVPVMFGDAHRATAIAAGLLERGIYAIAFSYPVVPEGAARIRVQLSAAHTAQQIDHAMEAFAEVRDACA